jgi:hypothetical protein
MNDTEEQQFSIVGTPCEALQHFDVACIQDAVNQLRAAAIPTFHGYYQWRLPSRFLEDVDEPYVRRLVRRLRYHNRKARSAKRRLIAWFTARGIALVFL